MDLKQQILHLYRVDELSLRAISVRLGIDRKTVSRVIKAYESTLAQNPGAGMSEALSSIPAYKKRNCGRRSMTPEVTKEIDFWIKENEKRRSSGMRKQCLKNQDIHRLLMEQGFLVSYSSVCKYISDKKAEKAQRSREVFLKISREPGVECEFDWGEVKLRIESKVVTFTMAVFAFPYSHGRRAYLFRHQDSLAFMESHRNFFRDVNGVPHIMVYDNMKVAVAFTDNGKKPTPALVRMCNFYKFNFRFCNARAGWEKGGVERSVEVVRRRAFTTRIDFDSIEEAQKWLDVVCERLNSENCERVEGLLTRYAEDIQALQEYPGEFGCFELSEYTVDKQSTIVVRKNHYSVPDSLVGEKVIAQLYSEKIVIYDMKHNKVATHQRSYDTFKWILDINHFINTLMKKTGALEHTEALKQMPARMQQLFRVHFKDNGKDFLQILKYASENGYNYEDILAAATEVRKRGARTLTADLIKVAMDSSGNPQHEYREEQKNESFLEIEIGSEDILNQLQSALEKEKN